jgi:FAD/FMN-containing dehydrogenase
VVYQYWPGQRTDLVPSATRHQENTVSRRYFSGWGGTRRSAPRQVIAPTSADHLIQALTANKQDSFLAHGLGCSYGDSALNADGLLIDCRFLDHFLAFDNDSGVLECESGVTVLQINRLLVPCGWMLPVTPGTQFVTIGGAIANDVHGKNHLHQGTFGTHTKSLQLARSDGSLLECSAANNAELFAATIGGLGLTGLILKAKLQLQRVFSLTMQVKRIPCKDLAALFSIATEHRDAWQYHSVWLDPARGCRRGLYIAANHDQRPGDLNWPRRRPIGLGALAGVPSDLAGRLLMGAGNLWYRRGTRTGTHVAPAASILYPLDRVPGWNALFGKPGFYQHQCVLPEPVYPAALEELLKAIADHDQTPSLAVGKWFGSRPSSGLLSFPTPGFSLALDFANRGAETRRLLDQLDRIVASHSGRLYPAKDARMSATVFASGYPNLEQFAETIDPRFSSDFWRRMEPALG